jgi:uracil-DNA glycosylase
MMKQMATKLNWELFSPLFGDWSSRFKPFFDEGNFDSIYDRLKKDSLRGKRVAPLSTNVFRCFKETSINDVKVIVVGISPYHTFTGWTNRFLPGADVTKESKIIPVADGLCLSCSVTGRLQPSLIQWYSACEGELNYGEESVRNPDLLYLAKQGVLLLNAGLTVEEGKPCGHNALWEPFMKYLFEEVLVTNGVPVILLGKEAQKLKRYIMPFTWIFELSHPASASYANVQWNSNQVFTNCNKILKDNNQNFIQWIQTE